jgi:hypothetical protein
MYARLLTQIPISIADKGPFDVMLIRADHIKEALACQIVPCLLALVAQERMSIRSQASQLAGV